MKTKNTHRQLLSVLFLLGSWLITSAQAGAVFTSLYSFSGTNDGANPRGGLVQGRDGSFYGTTRYGGTNNLGTVFNISTSGALTSLYSFTGTNDGANPLAGLVQGSDGNFYGTTPFGGTNNFGTVFKITTNGVLTSLYSFGGTNDDANPYATLVQGSDGNFYGTTEAGGTNGLGAVFKITTNGALTSLYSFTGGADGAYPRVGLVQGSDGNFYGTTAGHGPFFYPCAVFQISANGALTPLYTFNPPWFEQPIGLVQGSDGNFYGATLGGGTYGNGNVFNISTNGALTNLYSFTGTNDGGGPAGLVQGSDGSFYGTTQYGGTNNLGTVFRLTIQPPLTMTLSGANVILSWPINYPGWYLQKTVNLGATGGWVSVTLIEPPIIVNGQFAVTLPITSPQQGYYRLSSP